jgi:deoxyribonuclease V
VKVEHRHRWDLSVAEAQALQASLAVEVVDEDRLGEVRRVAGVDVGFERGGELVRAAVVVLSLPGLEVEERAIARRPTAFPYVPGLLSFREAPAILDALGRLGAAPDLLLCDGQGRAHPRRFGIACHIGLLADLPSIGVAKSLLVGRHEEPPDERGAWTPLVHRREVVGAALRTRPGTKPVYVSPGHRVSLGTAVDWVMRCTTRYRLPETTRHAHRLASEEAERRAGRGAGPALS